MCWRTIAIVALVAGVASAAAAPQVSRNAIQSSDDLVDSLYSDCLQKNSVSCVKYKLFSFVDKVLSGKDSFTLTEGVTVVQAPASVNGDGAPRALTPEDAASQDVETMLTSRLRRFLDTHTVKIDLKGSDVLNAVSSAGRALGDAADTLGLTETESSVGEERGKKKKAAKILLPLLLMLKLKAAALIPLALGAIALIAGKALLIGKIALLLASIIGLKKLLSQQQKTVTYEIVSHPHHGGGHDSYSSGSGGSFGGGGGGDYGGSSGHGGGWGRSADAHDIAYRAQAPVSQQ